MVSRRMFRFIQWLPVLTLALILCGCGQKGDLYLPDREATGTPEQE